jgi:hypothetical protein
MTETSDHDAPKRLSTMSEIRTVEHPILSTDDDLSQAAFRTRVVERQASVVEDAA